MRALILDHLSVDSIQRDLNRLCAYPMVRNPGSGRVLQKSGFVREGVLRHRLCEWGVFEEVQLEDVNSTAGPAA